MKRISSIAKRRIKGREWVKGRREIDETVIYYLSIILEDYGIDIEKVTELFTQDKNIEFIFHTGNSLN